MRAIRVGAARFVLLVLFLPLLAGCYLPDQFVAEIRLGGNGTYAITYQGILTWVPLLADIKRNKLPPGEARKKVAEIEKDLRRDENFKEITSLGSGQFRVRYERFGRLKETEMVTFIRRNAVLITMTSSKDGTVKIAGTSMPKNEGGEVRELGLNMEGSFRVVTGATVLKHNAGRIEQNGPFQTYFWQINSTNRQPPKIVIQLH
ncbi:MAG: hypothetical protein HQL37_02200 [Alphaproteobacteria bacterium]|nr:hypothetical protein [Alphaproteobacteria bacterium]